MKGIPSPSSKVSVSERITISLKCGRNVDANRTMPSSFMFVFPRFALLLSLVAIVASADPYEPHMSVEETWFEGTFVLNSVSL